MKYLDLPFLELDPKDYIKKQVSADHCSKLVDYDCVIRDADTGEHFITYIHKVEDDRMEPIRRALLHTEYQKSTRTGGLETNSRIFGYAPRNSARSLTCREASMGSEQPVESSTLKMAARVIEGLYQKWAPEAYEHHRTKGVEKIENDWRMEGTVFTSGIANLNNALHYHFDAGNVKDCRSAMFAFKEKIEGGELCVPELDLRFNLGDCSLILFDGQSLIHGVAPLRVRLGGYRITAVFYTLEEMWRCLPIDDEVALERSRRTKLELARAEGAEA